jgi:hypothetical protein
VNKCHQWRCLVQSIRHNTNRQWLVVEVQYYEKTERIHVTTLLGLFKLYKVFGAIHTPQYKWPISVSVNKLL